MMTKLYLVRHAEADGNIYRRVHGQYDGYVTPNGYKQIECLRRRFASIHIDAVYASDLYRTQQTAKAIYEGRDIPVTLEKNLREIKFGCWEDLPWGELLVSYPQEYELWMRDPTNFQVRGSETHAQLYKRVKAALDKIVLTNPGKTVAVVTHGTAIRTLLTGLMYQGDLSKMELVPWCDNTAVSLLECDENLQYKIEFYNDNSHLAELSTFAKQPWWREEEDDPALYNLRFVPAQFPRDIQKADEYYHEAWKHVFGVDDYDSQYSISRMSRMLSANPQAIVFALQGEREIGVVMLDTRARLVPGGGHIALLYLAEGSRGKSLGAQLLGHAVSVYRGLRRKAVTIRVASTNEHAIAFYKKYGFEQFGLEESGAVKQILMKKSIYF